MKKCQFCAEEVQDDAIVCKHCGKELNKQAVRKQEYKWTVGKISCAVILIPIILGFVITLARGCSGSDTTTPNNAQPSVGVGQEGFLRTSDVGGDVYVATTESAFDEFVKAAVIKDTIGMAQMVLNGRAFGVPYNTKILVTESAFTKKKVRILEGKQLGKIGWVPFEFVVAK